MATILRPPLITAAQGKRNIGFAFIASNLLLTTLAPLQPPGDQLFASAPPIKKQVACGQIQSRLPLGINPNAQIAQWDESAPRVRQTVSVDPIPNLLGTTLLTSQTFAPAVVVDLGTFQGKYQVYVDQPKRSLVLGINPNAAVVQLDESAPRIIQQVQTALVPNLLVTTLASGPTLSLPLNAERWDDSAPPPKIQVFAVQQHNLLALGNAPNPMVHGISESAPPPKFAVQVDRYPNLLTNTMAPPITVLPAREKFSAVADIRYTVK